MKQTAVEWLKEQYDSCPSYEQFLGQIEWEQAKAMEDSQATDYAKWSMDINELTGHFFTFLEWIKDEPKDDENL